MDSSSSIIPRHKPSNPYNYDDLTLATKRKEVTAASKDYPNVPCSMIEMAWDLVKNTANIDEIIKNGEWSNAEPKARPEGGVYQNITIE